MHVWAYCTLCCVMRLDGYDSRSCDCNHGHVYDCDCDHTTPPLVRCRPKTNKQILVVDTFMGLTHTRSAPVRMSL